MNVSQTVFANSSSKLAQSGKYRGNVHNICNSRNTTAYTRHTVLICPASVFTVKATKRKAQIGLNWKIFFINRGKALAEPELN